MWGYEVNHFTDRSIWNRDKARFINLYVFNDWSIGRFTMIRHTYLGAACGRLILDGWSRVNGSGAKGPMMARLPNLILFFLSISPYTEFKWNAKG